MIAASPTEGLLKRLPGWLRYELDNPPKAGGGVHNWTYRMGRNLHAHMGDEEMETVLLEKLQGCGRHVSRREVENAVRNSKAHAWRPSGTVSVSTTTQPSKRLSSSNGYSKWPALDEKEREAVIKASEGGLAELWESSNPRLDSDEPMTEQIVDSLFPGNPLLCCGATSYSFDTRPREEWRGKLSELQLIVPSPMTSETGLTQDGKESSHCLANTGPRRYLVVEFDSGTLDEQAALLFHLGTTAPLACVVFSGSKSLHGWFYVAGQDEEKAILPFFQYAVSIGADRAQWTRSQFVRMPDGLRGAGLRQTVYYLNGNVMGGGR